MMTGMRTVSGPTDRVVVVGAGLGGLACALHLLARAGREVTVVEREVRRRPGRVDDARADRGGFRRIQRDSVAIARSLVRHGHPFHLPRPARRDGLLDALLLDVLDRDPAQLGARRRGAGRCVCDEQGRRSCGVGADGPLNGIGSALTRGCAGG
jgi:glycine/D-amino acid oxidase-like deaminating enzyme